MHYPGPPASSLSVTVHSGREMPDGDWLSKMDPFVKVSLGGKEQKTSVKKGKTAIWEQTFTFNYSNEPSLKFTLWDKDLVKNDYLGVHELSLLPILTMPDRRYEGEVSLVHNKGTNAGYLKITLEFYPRGDSSAHSSAPQTPQAHYPPTPAPAMGQVVVNAPAPVYGAPSYPPQGMYPPQGYPAQQPGYAPPPTGYPHQQAYPPQGYPPQAYPPQAQGYPPQAYPQQQPGYPPQQQPGYPPQQQPGYPPQQQAGYPPTGYPPQQGYPPQGYAQPGYPPH